MDIRITYWVHYQHGDLGSVKFVWEGSVDGWDELPKKILEIGESKDCCPGQMEVIKVEVGKKKFVRTEVIEYGS